LFTQESSFVSLELFSLAQCTRIDDADCWLGRHVAGLWRFQNDCNELQTTAPAESRAKPFIKTMPMLTSNQCNYQAKLRLHSTPIQSAIHSNRLQLDLAKRKERQKQKKKKEKQTAH